MWKLEDISARELSAYSKVMLTKVEHRIMNPPKYPFKKDRNYKLRINSCINILTDKNLESLFVSKPVDLESINETLMKKLIPNYSVDFPRYVELKQKDRRNASENREYKRLSKKFYKINRDLGWLMGFDDIVSKDKDFSYWICKIKDAETCTYCNRQYTFTIGNKSTGYITRPQLDHWRPKSLFPLMSLSFYNLIPSCSCCNSSLKGAAVFSLGEYVHPYLQVSNNPDFSFYAVPDDADEWKLELRTTSKDPLKAKQVNQTIDAFNLKEIYAMHNSLEVKDLMTLIQKNSGSYIKTLLGSVMSDFTYISQADAIRLLLGVETTEEQLDKRPFSKLKRDLLKNAGII